MAMRGNGAATAMRSVPSRSMSRGTTPRACDHRPRQAGDGLAHASARRRCVRKPTPDWRASAWVMVPSSTAPIATSWAPRRRPVCGLARERLRERLGGDAARGDQRRAEPHGRHGRHARDAAAAAAPRGAGSWRRPGSAGLQNHSPSKRMPRRSGEQQPPGRGSRYARSEARPRLRRLAGAPGGTGIGQRQAEPHLAFRHLLGGGDLLDRPATAGRGAEPRGGRAGLRAARGRRSRGAWALRRRQPLDLGGDLAEAGLGRVGEQVDAFLQANDPLFEFDGVAQGPNQADGHEHNHAGGQQQDGGHHEHRDRHRSTPYNSRLRRRSAGLTTSLTRTP